MCLEDSGELLGAGGLEPWVSSRKVAPPPPSPDKGCLHQGLELVWRVWLLFPGCSYLGGGGNTPEPEGKT